MAHQANPFTQYANPKNAREAQSNANYATYERMGAEEELREFDKAGIKAPWDVIDNARTWRWVEREHIRIARKMRLAERA
jgi:hypothetical protein